MKTISSAHAPTAIGPYAQAMVVAGPGHILFISGQIALHPVSGEMVQGGIEAETGQVLANLEAILKEAGMDMQAVVKTTIFMKDMNEFQARNIVYEAFFKGHKPGARSTVEVSSLPRNARVEIEAIAVQES